MSQDVDQSSGGAGSDTGVDDRRTTMGLLIGLPLICIVVLGGWVIWRMNADLDDIEARQLAWGTILRLTREHIVLTLISTAAVLLTAVPAGILLTRPRLRRFAGPVTAFANTGQAAPVIGVIVLLAIWLGFGTSTAVLALSIYAFLPVLRNTIVGLEQVDPTLIEAARGMGMSGLGVLRRIELPLALPVIMVGIRTAVVLLVGAASFATFINAGGLGALIVTGISLFRYPVLISGALIIAVLALLIDWAGRVVELLLSPKGTS